MDQNVNALARRASELASELGSRIKKRRQTIGMTQEQLALATGVGRRFLIELEAGKGSCRLGLSLVVAEALGLRSPEGHADSLHSPAVPDLPELFEGEGEDG